MKKYILPIAFVFFMGCTSTSDYEYIINDTYDTPAKTSVVKKVVIQGDYDSLKLRSLADELFNDAKKGNFKYHKEPTQIFVYIYKSFEDNNIDGTNWLAMKSINSGEYISTFQMKKKEIPLVISKKTNQFEIGKWIEEEPKYQRKFRISKENGKYTIHSIYKDGQETTKPLILKVVEGEERLYEKTSKPNRYYVKFEEYMMDFEDNFNVEICKPY